LKKYILLGKFSVIFPVSLTAFMGYFLFEPTISYQIIIVSLGVFLLGVASSSLNQIQEKEIDAQMERTKNRPLPAGTINLTSALIFSILSFTFGMLTLFIWGTTISALLGLFTVLWYNGLYTFLKRKTAIAVIPGSLTGAIPPIIGWTAAGGSIYEFKILLVAFIFFIGQVPHFWLLLAKYGDQYTKAKLPNLTNIFSPDQIKRLSFIWVAASLTGTLMLLNFNLMRNHYLRFLVLVVVFLLLIIFIFPVLKKARQYNKSHFILLNTFYLFLILILMVNEIIS
jgi:protoheme IX farnesyltransferase